MSSTDTEEPGSNIGRKGYVHSNALKRPHTLSTTVMPEMNGDKGYVCEVIIHTPEELAKHNDSIRKEAARKAFQETRDFICEQLEIKNHSQWLFAKLEKFWSEFEEGGE